MFSRTRRFFDRYGMLIGAMLFIAFCWFTIANNFHHTRALFILSPVNWVLATPAGPAFRAVIDPFLLQVWWVPVGTILTASVWLVLFFGARGIYYNFTSMNAYYGIVIAIVAVIVIAFIIWVVLPTFDEVNSWRGNWPGRTPGYIGK